MPTTFVWNTLQFPDKSPSLSGGNFGVTLTDWIWRGFAEALPPQPLQRASRLSPRVQAAAQTVLRRDTVYLRHPGEQAENAQREFHLIHLGRSWELERSNLFCADVSFRYFPDFFFARNATSIIGRGKHPQNDRCRRRQDQCQHYRD